MTDILPQFQIAPDPIADPKAMVTRGNARFTVLNSRLIRLETGPAGQFEDRPSQAFWYRRQPAPKFEVREAADRIEIETEHLLLRYAGNGQGFNKKSLSIQLKETGAAWHFGDVDQTNLRGTTRTLDETDGWIRLEQGLMSRSGWAVVDDSRSLVFSADSWLEPRAHPESQDLYFFGYGHDYRQCLADFRQVSGPTPLIPRWLLGNWWSRYWAYSQADLTDLIVGFEQNEIPLSICIIDMDWHIVRLGSESHWTGYTWNKELFPDPKGLIAWLHGKGLRTALNLHPADGVKPHESQYPEFARFMGLDPASREPVEFDCVDPKFVKGYFELLHHPMEADGVDFWWLDWQQGRLTKMPGLDPLWWLNHLHFHDLGRGDKKRPFIFSRWGGLGNHRYPIGFSGDTVVSWKSLALQPSFTAAAANVGYGWWSHDIGGHMAGMENPELFARWVQWGVFSPILRLHSTANPYQERRPWMKDAETLRLIRAAMQLRHRLIPYLYTMAWRDYTESLPLIRPMYHSWPENEEAYACPNQYTFGSELVAAPFTSASDEDTRLSRQDIWLPGEDWFDFFTGEHFQGGKWHTRHGRLDDIPVFARAGAIVPLGPHLTWGGVDNPEKLELHIFPGADNRFELYEDDGVSNAHREGKYSLTPFVQAWQENRLQFKIEAVRGQTAHLPPVRTYELIFAGIKDPEHITVEKNKTALKTKAVYDASSETLTIAGIELKNAETLTVTLASDSGSLLSKRDRRLETARRMLWSFRMPTDLKVRLGEALPEILKDPSQLHRFGPEMKDAHLGALKSILQ